MVAVIAGAGLGVFNSNVTTGVGVSGQAELGQARERVYVNAATGNLVLQNTDEQVMGLGLGFSLLRTYNSQANFDGDNNDQWRLGFISTVSLDGQNQDYLRTTADGFIQRFKPSGVDGEYISFEGQGHADKLVVKAGKIEIRSDGDVTETYTGGKLTSRKTPQGEVTVTYSGSKPVDIRLTVLDANQTATTTQTLTINYYPDTDPAAGLLRSLSVKDERDVIQNRVEYLYDSEKRLQSVVIDKTPQLTTDSNNVALNKDGNKFVIEYGYVGTSKQINLVRQYQASNKDSTNDNKTELAITYYDANEPAYRAGRVKTLTQGLYLTTYDYLNDNQTRVIQGGQSVDYEFDPQDRLVKVSYDLKGGVSTTSYRYNANGQLETVTDGLGQKTEYFYDANGNVRQISVPGQPTIIRTYNSNNKLLTEQRGSAVTRYVYDNSGQLLRFAIAADGGVSEYRYNNFKQMIQQRIYHDKEYNISALGATQVPQLGDLESWVADLADKSAQQLTEFSYDVRGQVKTKTQYASVNSSGGGEGTASVWSYLYDLRGQLLQETKPKGYGTASLYDETVTYAYDGLGRLLTSVDAQSNSTTIVNADHNRTQQIRLDNGRYETLTFDKSGRVVSKQIRDQLNNKDLGTERFYYDDAGRLAAQQDQYGQRTYRFYEENGELAAEVNPVGAVTRYYYDLAGRLERTVAFAARLTTSSSWFSVDPVKVVYTLGQLDAAIQPWLNTGTTSDSARRESRIVYQNNLKQYEIDAAGYVTAYEYDSEFRLSQKRLYAVVANDTQRNNGLTGFDFNGALASSESYGYDSAGRLVTLTNGEGYRTQHYYDKAGRKIATRQYANQVVSNTVKESDNDLLEHWRYDGQGRVIAHVAADGAVSRFEYNLNGQVERSIQYAQVVRSLGIGATLSWPTGESRVTSNSYDGNGRLIQQTQPDGQTTFYRYDAVGNVTEKWQGKAATNAAGMTDILRTDFSGGEHSLLAKGVYRDVSNIAAKDQVYWEDGRMVMSRQTSVAGVNPTTGYFATLQVSSTLSAKLDTNREVQFDFTLSHKSDNHFLGYFTYQGWGQADHTRLGVYVYGDKFRSYTTHNMSDRVNNLFTVTEGKSYRVRMNTSSEGVAIVVFELSTEGLEQEVGRQFLTVPAAVRDREFGFVFESNSRLNGPNNKTYIDNFVIRAPELPALVDTNQLHTVERYQYDVNGNRIAVLDANANANANVGAAATQAQVNAAFNANPSARYVYNQRGQLVESRDAEDSRTLYFYDNGGRLTVKIDPERVLTRYAYNGFDELVGVHSLAKPIPQKLYEELLKQHDDPKFIYQGMQWGGQSYVIDKVLNSYISNDPLIAVNKSPDDSWQQIGRNKQGLEADSYRDLTTAPVWGGGHQDALRTFSAYNALGLLADQTVRQRYADSNWAIQSSSLKTVFNYDKRGLADTVIRNGVVLSDSDYDAFGRVTLQKAPAKANIETSYQLSAADRQNNQLGRVITTSQTLNQGSAQQQLRQDIIRYDAFGRVLETQDALGTVTRYQYDDTSRSFTVTNSKTGISTETRRNLLGRVSEVVIKQGGTVLQTSRYEYDANGNLLESFLNGVLQESRTYNKNNQLRFVTDATRSRSETEYDKNGRVVKTVVDVDGLKLTTHWDFSAGRSEVKQTEGSRVSWTGYDKNGRVKYLDRLEVVDGVSYRVRTSYSYDQAGQKIEVVNGQRFTVDANQKVTGDADNSAAQTQKFDYDLLGRLVRQYTVLGSGRVNEVQYSYNDADQLIEKKELLSATQQKRTFYSYNQAGEVQAEAVSHSELDGKLRVSLQKFEYDAKGRRIASHQYLSLLNTNKAPTAAISASEMTTLIGNAAGPVASSYVAYDAQDRVVARINPTGSRSFTRYDGLGRVTETFTSLLIRTVSNEELAQLKAGNFGYGDAIYSGLGDARTSYVYDNQNRVAYQLVSTGSQAMVTGYRYDAEGKLSQTRQFTTLADYAANPAKGKLDSLATSNEDRVSQQFYDSADRLRYVIDSSGLVTQYVYNVHGQRLSETRHADLIGTKGALATSWQQGSLSYADLQTAYPDSAIASGSRQISTEYDLLGRVSKITYPAANNQSAAQSERFKYNAAGLQTQKTDQAGNDWVTKYDQAGRIEVQEVPEQLSERYTYNLAGQKATYTDRNGKVWQYQYDLAGRLQAEFTPLLTADDKVQVQLSNGEYVQATGYGKKHYQYDAQGNLTELTEGMVRQLTDTAFYQESRNGNLLNSQARTTSFAYDVAGRQTRVTQPVAENAPATYTETGYDALGRAIRSTLYSDGTAVKTEHKVYDAAGRVRFDVLATLNTNGDVTQPSKGFVTEYQYNAFGQQNKLVRYNGEQILTLAGLSLGTWTLPADPANRTIETEYDSAGRKWKVLEDSRAYSYWQAGALVNHTDRPETVFEYNSFGEVWKTSVKATPTEWLHSYNWYDNLGRQTHTLDAAGYLSRRSYNSLGEVETYTEYARAIATTNFSQQTPPALPVAGDQQTGADRSWSYGYDKLGRRISETLTGALYHQHAGSSISSQTLTTTTGYDGNGQVIRRTDATGQLDLSYNALGQLVQQVGKNIAIAGNVRDLSALSSLSQQTQLMRQQSHYQYDVFGNMVHSRQLAGTQANDSLDKITRYKYNTRGQAVQQTDLLGTGLQRVIVSRYQADGKIQRQEVGFDELVAGQSNTVRRNYVTSYSYDAQGQQRQLLVESNTAEQPAQLKVIDRQDNEFNAFGEMVSQHRLNSAGVLQLQHRFVYNTSGLLVNTDEKEGAISTHSYDLAGRLVQVSHALNGTQRFVLDALGRQSQVHQQGMQANQFYVTTQQFDRWGNVTRLTDARGYSYDYQYNHLNKVVAEFKPETTAVHIDGSAESLRPDSYFRYNSQGLLLLETDANGNQKKYQYDASGNVTVTTDAEGRSTSYGYDLMGRLVAQQGPAGLIETTLYNQFGLATETGRVVKVQNAQAQWYQYETVNKYQYNAAAQRISSTDANGDLTHYRYNGKDQLIMSLSATGLRKKYDYDSLGNQILASSQLGSSAVLQTSKTTSADGIVTSQRDLSGVETRYQFVQTALLNAAGNPSGSGNSNRVQRVEVTDAGERNKKLRYDYYANGWLKSVTDELNHNSSTYVYNEHGQRVLETHVATDLSGNVFTQNVQTSYDELGRVRKVEVSDENNKLTSKVTYRYDAVGNRRAMTVANGLEGDIQPVQAIPLNSLLTLPLKADSTFTTKQLQLNQLFETDEVALLRLELAASVPDWLQLNYQPDGSFVLSNKPGKKAPLLNVSQVEVSLNAIERSTGRVMATNKLLFRLVAPSELEVKADALPNQQLRWHQIARGLLKPISFVSSFNDKDGDAITIKSPVIYANGRELNAAEFSRYFSWDNKKAELTIKAELAELEAQHPELTLKVDVKASSLGNTVVTEQTKSLLISIKKNNKPVVVSELPANTPGYLLPDQTVLHGVRAGTGAAVNKLSLDINSYFTDGDGDALRLVKVEGLPNFLFSVRSEDGSGRIQNWPGDQNQESSFRPLAVGTYDLKAIVTDGYEESVVNFRLIVNPAGTPDPAATINWPLDRSIGEGQSSSFNLNSAANPALKFRPAGEHKLPVGLTLHADGRIIGVLNNAAVQPPKNAQGQITSNGWDKKASQFGVKVIDLNTGLASDTRNLPLTLRNTPVAYKDSSINQPTLTVLTGYSDTSSEWLKLADIPASFVTASEGRIVTETPVSNRSRVELVSSSEKYRLDWNGVSHSGAIYIKKGATAPQESVQLRVIDGGTDGHGSHVVTLPVQAVASPVRYNASAPAAINLNDTNAALNVRSFFNGFDGFADKNAANQPIVSFGVSFTLNGSRYVSGAMSPLQFDAATGLITGWTALSDAVRRQLNGTDVAMQFDIYYQWQGVSYSLQAPATKAVRMTYQPPLEARFESFSPAGTVAEDSEVSFNVVMSKGRAPYSMPTFSAAGASRQVNARPLAAGDYLISQVNDNTFNIIWRIGNNAVGGSGWNTANVALQVSGSKDADGVLVPTASANISVENRPVPWDGSGKQLEFSKSVDWSTVYAEKVEIGVIPEIFVRTADGRLVTTQKNGNLSSLRLAAPVPAGFSLEWNQSTHTGTLYITDKYSLPLPGTIAVELHDSDYGWRQGSIKLNIQSQRPPVGAVGKQNFVEGQDIEIRFREIIKDPDGTPIQFGEFKIEKKEDGVGNDNQWAWVPSPMGSVRFDAVSGIMFGNLGYESAGIYKVTLHYTDAIGGVPTVFEVNIADKAKPVTLIRPIPTEDLTFDEGKVSVIDLSQYFSPAEPAGSDHNYIISEGSIPSHYILSKWGMLRVDASYSDAGPYKFTLKVTNSIGGFIEVPLTLTIVNKNQPPVVNQPIPSLVTANVGDNRVLDLAPYFRDPEAKPLNFSAEFIEDSIEDFPGAPRTVVVIDGVSIDSSGKLQLAPTSVGNYIVELTVKDADGATLLPKPKFKLQVANAPVVNQPPRINPSNPSGKMYATQNSSYPGSYDVSRHFIDNDSSLAYTPIGPLPNGLTMSGGLISGKPSVSGTYTVTVRATEASGLRRSVDTSIEIIISPATVYAKPTLTPSWGSDHSVGESQSPNYQISAQDNAGGSFTYSDNGGLPAGLRLNPSTGRIEGEITKNAISTSASDPWEIRTFTFSVKARSQVSGLESDWTSFSIKVRNIPTAWNKTGASLPSVTVQQGQALTVDLNSFLTAPENNKVSASSSTSWASLNNAGQLTINAANLSAGTHSYTLVVNDYLHGSHTVTGSITVTAAPKPIVKPVLESSWTGGSTWGEGQWPNQSIGVKNRVAGESFAFSLSGSLPPGLSFNPNTGAITNQIRTDAITTDPTNPWRFQSFTFSVTATNLVTGAVSDATSFTMVVRNTPTPWNKPSASLPQLPSVKQGEHSWVDLTGFLTAPEGNRVQVISSDLHWVQYNAQTGRLVANAPYGVEVSQHPFTLTISDGDWGTKQVSGYITVLRGSGGGDLNSIDDSSLDNITEAEESIAVVENTAALIEKPAAPLPNLANTAAVTNSAPVYAKTRSYWYTYDKTNQVVIDGGSINAQTGIVDIHQQGRYVSYNAAGQQDFVVTLENGKQKGQRFEYNNRNQLAVVYQSAEAYQGLWVNSGSFYKFDYNYQPLLSGDVTKTLNSRVDWRRLQAYEYDNVGRLTATYDYGSQALAHTLDLPTEDVDFSVLLDMRGTLQSVQRSIYNADGQVTQVRTNQLQADMSGAALKSFFSDKLAGINNLPVADGAMLRLQDYVPTAEASMVSGTVTTYQNFNAQGLAEQTKSSVTKANGAVDQYSWQRSYVSRDSLLESKVTGTASSGTKGGQFKDATTFTDYDAHGNKVLVVEGNEANGSELSIRQMLYAADGSLLRMQQSALAKENGDALTQVKARLAQIRAGQSTALHQSRESRHISSNGDYLGEIAVLRGDVNNARDNWYFSSTIKEQHFSSELAAGNASERHTVRAGDTLQSLAQLYYGNADYWYLIAAANGLSSVQGPAQQPAAGEAAAVAQQLVEGMTLDIPVRASSFNSHHNFKPMDLATIIGDTTPTVPYLPPPPAAGCNAVAMVVMIAITAVAAVATAGAAAAAMGGGAFSMSLGASAMMGGATIGAGTVAATTVAAGTLGSVLATSAVAAAAGGFVGSVAGQLAGKAMGVVDSFSLKNAFASGLTAGATAGLGGALNNTSWATEAGKLDVYGKMAIAASSVGINVAANKLAGNRGDFKWRNVVSSVVTAGVMDYVELSNQSSVFEKFSDSTGIISGTLQNIAGAAIGYGVSKGLYNEGSWNFRNVAQDAFGNAVGNSIVSKLSQPKGYQIGDEITVDGQKGYVAGVDENGQPTSISHSADNLRVERAQLEQWRVDDISFAMKVARQRGLAGWSYDSGQSGLINEGLIGGILNDEMHKMRQGLFRQEQNQQGHASGSQQKAAVASDWTQWLSDRSKEVQYLGNGLLGAKGLGLASQGYGLGLLAQAKPGGVGSVMQQLGLGQYSSLALSVDGSRLTHAANSSHYFSFGSTANMTNSFGLTDVLDSKPVKWFGGGLTLAGPLASGFQAIDYSFLQNNDAGHTWKDNFGGMASHWTKFTVDSGFAAASVLGGLPGIAAAAVYSVTDLALSVTPQYQIRYGDSKGQMVDGWEKAGFFMLDRTQDGIKKAVETGVGPRGVKLRPEPNPAPVTPRGRR